MINNYDRRSEAELARLDKAKVIEEDDAVAGYYHFIEVCYVTSELNNSYGYKRKRFFTF